MKVVMGENRKMTCTQCGRTEGQVQVGHNTSGTQRYGCHGCGHKYPPAPKHHGYDESIRQQALRLYIDGANLERILGGSRQRVANWVKVAAQAVPAVPPTPQAAIQVAELDEVSTFVGTKKTASTSSPKEIARRAASWGGVSPWTVTPPRCKR
jgi:transposase-like protein